MSFLNFFSSMFGSANIDGTPMAGDSGIDVLGKPYGVTDDMPGTHCATDMFSDFSPFTGGPGAFD